MHMDGLSQMDWTTKVLHSVCVCDKMNAPSIVSFSLTQSVTMDAARRGTQIGPKKMNAY